MRITTKILAAAALAVISVSSFAIPTDWTGSLANVKVGFTPINAEGRSTVILTGTNSPCTWTNLPGSMVLFGSAADTAAINTMFTFLEKAKTSGTVVTLTYEPTSTNCTILSVKR